MKQRSSYFNFITITCAVGTVIVSVVYETGVDCLWYVIATVVLLCLIYICRHRIAR